MRDEVPRRPRENFKTAMRKPLPLTDAYRAPCLLPQREMRDEVPRRPRENLNSYTETTALTDAYRATCLLPQREMRDERPEATAGEFKTAMPKPPPSQMPTECCVPSPKGR